MIQIECLFSIQSATELMFPKLQDWSRASSEKSHFCPYVINLKYWKKWALNCDSVFSEVNSVLNEPIHFQRNWTHFFKSFTFYFCLEKKRCLFIHRHWLFQMNDSSHNKWASLRNRNVCLLFQIWTSLISFLGFPHLR